MDPALALQLRASDPALEEKAGSEFQKAGPAAQGLHCGEPEKNQLQIAPAQYGASHLASAGSAVSAWRQLAVDQLRGLGLPLAAPFSAVINRFNSALSLQ